IGGLELRLGRPQNALEAYKQLVERAPHDPSALITVADTLLALGWLDEARAQASLAAETIPEDDRRWRAKAHETLAMIALARHAGDAVPIDRPRPRLRTRRRRHRSRCADDRGPRARGEAASHVRRALMRHLFLLAAMTCGLSACGGSSSTPTTPSNSNPGVA